MAREYEDQLLSVFRMLSAADQEAVKAFAEFLFARNSKGADSRQVTGTPAGEFPTPEAIERPAEEKVVAAIKRLSRTYPMLSKKDMLGATSDLVTQHLLQGREASEVIDQLEAIFLDYYRQLKERSGS